MKVIQNKVHDISWKNTFNSHLKRRDVEDAFSVAKNNGYPYVVWNGWVFLSEVVSIAQEDRLVAAEELPV